MITISQINNFLGFMNLCCRCQILPRTCPLCPLQLWIYVLFLLFDEENSELLCYKLLISQTWVGGPGWSNYTPDKLSQLLL